LQRLTYRAQSARRCDFNQVEVPCENRTVELARNDVPLLLADGQDVLTLALHLLQASLVYVDTRAL
jgi:hypothetical protein